MKNLFVRRPTAPAGPEFGDLVTLTVDMVNVDGRVVSIAPTRAANVLFKGDVGGGRVRVEGSNGLDYFGDASTLTIVSR